MAKARVTRSAAQDKLLGKNVLVFLNYGEAATYAAPVWSLLGGQRSASFSSSADEIDLTDKTSDGYGDSEQGIKNTELSIDLVCKSGDETLEALRDAYDKGEAVDILRWVKSGDSVRNWYAITEISDEASHDDAVTLSLTLKGKGKPTYTSNMTDPRPSGS